MKIKYLLLFLSFFIPYLIFYRAFFLGGHLVWGDAPYFYLENLKQLFNQPLLWDYRNDNFGAPQNYVLWLTLPTFLFGLLHQLFSLSNDVLIRLIFYIPATFLAPLGAWLFVSQFTKNIYAKFLAIFLYAFNTYFFLVLDGGQLGVALSFGLFPLAVYTLNNYIVRPSIRTFSLALLSLFFLSNVDLRTLLMVVMFLFAWRVIWLNNLLVFLKKFSLIIIPLAFLNSFWLLPMLWSNNPPLVNLAGAADRNFISNLNALTLFQPHFPLNEFGTLMPVPFYFGFIPALLLLGVVLKKNHADNKSYLTFLLMFLIFVFLAKGGGEPFGVIYSTLTERFPLGFAFRDSSKFFMPLLLSAGVLLAFSVEEVGKIFRKKLFLSFVLLIYLFLLTLVYPALVGKLTGTLATNQQEGSYDNIYQQLRYTDGFFRTLWFPEKPPLAFADWQRSAISANTLFKEPPFSAMIEGEYDLFNFLHHPQLSDWLKTLGIKYLFFASDERQKVITTQEVADRRLFLDFVDNIFSGKKLNWGTSFPVYEIADPKDRIFAQNVALITIGGMDVYQSLQDKLQFEVSSLPAIFLEDKLTNAEKLLSLPSPSAVLLLRDEKAKEDLVMSFLRSHFLNLGELASSEWGKYSSNELLRWRYELLNHNIKTRDLGFGGGLIYSSINGESFSLKTDLEQKADYYLAFRHIESSQSGALRIKVGSNEKNFNPSAKIGFSWDYVGPIELRGSETIKFENLGGFKAINQIAVVSEADLEKARGKAKQILDRFPKYYLEGDIDSLKNIVLSTGMEVSYKQKTPTEYSVNLSQNQPTWVIFSDHFNANWRLNGISSKESYPIYGMINGFWVDDGKGFNLRYEGQKAVKEGLAISVATFFILIGTLIFIYKKYEY